MPSTAVRKRRVALPDGLAAAASGFSVDVAWVRDLEMRRLARRFKREATRRGGTTDVLAFPYGAPVADVKGEPGAGPARRRAPRPAVEAHAGRLGEIVVNLELAATVAREHGNSREAEGVLYATHGLVHLLGGEDRTPGGRRAMREIEKASLACAGLRVRGGEWD